MAMLLVTHDLGVVSGLADRICVMYAGRIVESADSAGFLAGPRHPYSAGLLAAVPSIDDPPGCELRTIAGTPPRPGTVLPGCRFEPRCARAQARCAGEDPPWVEQDGAGIACHFPLQRGGQ
jgi:oligopeptide/dipeptide ABC transporter ATP-binding protein